MTFLEILQDVYDRVGMGQTAQTADARRIKRYVNRWNRKVLSKSGMEPLRRVIFTKASVADQPTYGVAASQIRYISEATTQRTLSKKTLDWYRANFPDPTTFTGTPEWWIPLGMTRAHTRPSAAATLYAVSTETADVGTIRVQAIRSNGYPVDLSVTLTGTTPVAIVNASGSGSITDVVDIVDVRLSAAQTGVVTVTQGSGGTELSRVLIGQTAARFLRYALAPTPSAAITYTIDAVADLVDLVNDTDEPFENADYHDLLVDGAVHDEYLNRGRGDDAAAIRVDMEARMKQLALSILEWPDSVDDDRPRTFDETIQEPIS